ncbi:MAG: efflux RND transporter periplasmic adaptor subunit, partial [Flavobacteriaceae bacterium]|nr:efflux RND transporter periplasmic adaptor subunit [Flavobacteriaceae bacterium]
ADKPENSSPFRPGMTATVDIITNKKENIIGIPISSIVIKTDTSSAKSKKIIKETISSKTEKFECVFVKIGDIAKLRVITTGIQDDSNIEITSGLNEGDDVITGPYNTVTKILKSGDKVESKVVDKKEEDEEDK